MFLEAPLINQRVRIRGRELSCCSQSWTLALKRLTSRVPKLFQGLIPCPFFSHHRSLNKNSRVPWVSGGFLERRIPGKNGSGRYAWNCILFEKTILVADQKFGLVANPLREVRHRTKRQMRIWNPVSCGLDLAGMRFGGRCPMFARLVLFAGRVPMMARYIWESS